MADDKKKGEEGGSKISNTEWGMAIFALLIIDLIEIGLDALFGIGAVINPFIDWGINLAWPTYLYLRGVNLKSAKNLATLLTGGGLQLIPGFDGFWAIEGTVIMFITKAEEKIKEETGVDVEKIASAAEGGDTGAVAEEAGAAGEAGAIEEGGMSDEYADSMGQESDAAEQEKESDNPYGDESEDEKSERMKGEEGDKEHEISDEDADELGKESDNKSEGDEDDKDKDKKKKKPQEKQGGRNNLFGGGGRGGGSSPLGSRNKNRYRSPEEKAEDERLSFHSNLLDLSDPYAARKKKENEESSHSE